MNETTKTLLSTQIDIPCKSEYVAVIRLTISGLASRLNFDIENIEDIKIAVSEACNNTVQHAYPNTDCNDARIKLHIETEENEFRITIRDNGIGFDPENVQSTNALDDNKLGLGLGIAFMKSLMDETIIDSHKGQGTTVTLIKKQK